MNEIGWSAYSNQNIVGALIANVPGQMAIPFMGDSTSVAQIEIKWATLTGTDTGESAITSFNLQKQIATDTWEDLVGSSTSFILLSYVATDGIIGGQSYIFRI